jgi:adenylate kinase
MPAQRDGKYICEACDTELFQRKDDNPETIAKRLDVYEEQTLPLVKYYTDKQILIRVNSQENTEAIVNQILA